MRDYELALVISPDVADEDVSRTVDRVSGLIKQRGGEVVRVDPWGRRRLAYPIRRFMEGSYVFTHIRMEPEQAQELEASLNISEDVLRHLLVQHEE